MSKQPQRKIDKDSIWNVLPSVTAELGDQDYTDADDAGRFRSEDEVILASITDEIYDSVDATTGQVTRHAADRMNLPC